MVALTEWNATRNLTPTELREFIQENAAGGGGLYVTDPAYGAVGDGSTDDTAAIQAAIDASVAAGTPYVPVVLDPGKQFSVTSTIDLKGVPLLGNAWTARPPVSAASWPGAIISNIPKSSTTVTGTDIAISGTTVSSTSTDLSVFSDEDIVVIVGGDSDWCVGTVTGTPTSTSLSLTETGAAFTDQSAGASTEITKLTPVLTSSVSAQVVRGVAVDAASSSGADFDASIASTSYVVGLELGSYNDTGFFSAHCDVNFRARAIVCGMVHNGYQNRIQTWFEKCPVGAKLTYQNGSDINCWTWRCGANHIDRMDGGGFLNLHEEDPDDAWRTGLSLMRNIRGGSIIYRAEAGGLNAKNWIQIAACDGSVFSIYANGHATPPTATVQVSNVTYSLFTGDMDAVTSGNSISYSGTNSGSLDMVSAADKTGSSILSFGATTGTITVT